MLGAKDTYGKLFCEEEELSAYRWKQRDEREKTHQHEKRSLHLKKARKHNRSQRGNPEQIRRNKETEKGNAYAGKRSTPMFLEGGGQ